jgi:hypothetical protein
MQGLPLGAARGKRLRVSMTRSNGTPRPGSCGSWLSEGCKSGRRSAGAAEQIGDQRSACFRKGAVTRHCGLPARIVEGCAFRAAQHAADDAAGAFRILGRSDLVGHQRRLLAIEATRPIASFIVHGCGPSVVELRSSDAAERSAAGKPADGHANGQRYASNSRHSRNQLHRDLRFSKRISCNLRSISGSIGRIMKDRSSSVNASLAVNQFSPASCADNDDRSHRQRENHPKHICGARHS